MGFHVAATPSAQINMTEGNPIRISVQQGFDDPSVPQDEALSTQVRASAFKYGIICTTCDCIIDCNVKSLACSACLSLGLTQCLLTQATCRHAHNTHGLTSWDLPAANVGEHGCDLGVDLVLPDKARLH